MQGLTLVCGAGGFIGGHLVRQLLADGCTVRAVDHKPPEQWYQRFPEVENISADLSSLPECRRATQGAATIYNLAADMGGMGYIESHKTACMLNVLINTHLLMAAQESGTGRYFFASSACVYAADKQLTAIRVRESY